MASWPQSSSLVPVGGGQARHDIMDIENEDGRSNCHFQSGTWYMYLHGDWFSSASVRLWEREREREAAK